MCTQESFVARFFRYLLGATSVVCHLGLVGGPVAGLHAFKLLRHRRLPCKLTPQQNTTLFARLSHRNDRSHPPPMRRPSVHISAVRVLLEPEN